MLLSTMFSHFKIQHIKLSISIPKPIIVGNKIYIIRQFYTNRWGVA